MFNRRTNVALAGNIQYIPQPIKIINNQSIIQ